MNAPREAIRRALRNPALQAALDANAQRRREARTRAQASLPQPWAVLRHRAAQVRAEVLAHWPTLLETFIAHARANGFQVHWAADAAQARQIILDIVAAQGPAPRLVAKSKSMVTEEIGLNAALEAAGHRVVETDLGEFIVQLRGERPAHIITPAVHLRRQEVAQTFHDLLGVPYTENVAALTATARRHLREVFLQADVGISGVNFGIAATGSLCLVTNEGNGRMVTTLPPVHIAVMGAERLVRTWEDLALMLELLPRSATGQDLTVYTTLIHGPRRAGEPDGPPTRHLVIVDNGRQPLAQTPLAEALRCIRCGACLNACPVFQEIGGHAYVGRHGEPTPYPGPIGIVLSPGLFGFETYGNLPYLCTLCGACAEACPVEVPLPELILQARAQAGEVAGAPFRPWLDLYAWTATHPRIFRLAQEVARPLAQWGGRWAPVPFLQGVTPTEKAGPTAPPPAPAPRAPQAGPAPSPPADRVARFTAALTALNGEVVRVARQDLAAALRQRWEAQGRPLVTTWDPAAFPQGLGRALQEANLPTAPAPQAALGITGALLGIAETGSVVLPSGPGQPQAASLLPEAHWVLLPLAALVDRLEEGLTAPGITAGSMAVVVTGPSRTADIEMTLTLGVHGPAQVVVFLVE